jgi:hypothetical protein
MDQNEGNRLLPDRVSRLRTRTRAGSGGDGQDSQDRFRGQPHGFLATPVPEPSTLLLLGISCGYQHEVRKRLSRGAWQRTFWQALLAKKGAGTERLRRYPLSPSTD